MINPESSQPIDYPKVDEIVKKKIISKFEKKVLTDRAIGAIMTIVRQRRTKK